MKILVTGANGFLGQHLTLYLSHKSYDVVACSRGKCRIPHQKAFQYFSFDLTDANAVAAIIASSQPDVIVHAAAMSKPDECEMNQMKAYLVNVEGTVQLLINSEEVKSFFIFLSTDFVFDGERGMYNENDAPKPVNYYGRTKLEAEEAVKEYENGWAIVRTVLVYGKNHSGRRA